MTMDPHVDIHRLFETHGVFVSRLARALVSEEHAAEDLAQETWASVARQPPVGVRNIRAWLATVLRRRAVEGLRRGRASVELEPDEPAATSVAADEAAARLEVEHLLQSAVRDLDEPYRTVIYLRFHEGLPPREIATRLGAPVKTIKTRLSRGLERLRAALDRKAAESEDPGRDWRLALVPVALVRPRGAAAAAPMIGALPVLALGMKKFLFVVVAILLSVGLLSRLTPGGPSEVNPGLSSEEPSLEGTAQGEEPRPVPTRLAEVTAQDGRARVLSPAATPAVAGRADSGSLTVEVVDTHGAPIQGRTVLLGFSAWTNAGLPPTAGRTDASGQVLFDDLAESDFLVTDAHGGKDEIVDLGAGEAKRLRWTMETDVLVEGWVRDGDGTGLGDAEVWCSASGEVDQLAWPLARTDADGGFSLRCSKDAALFATATGKLASPMGRVRAQQRNPEGVHGIEFVLNAPGVRLEGRVLDAAGAPVPDAQVLVQASAPASVSTRETGRFEFPGALPKGSHTVIARAVGFAPAMCVIQVEDDVVDLDLVLHRGGEVTGRVFRPDGTPASKAHVWVAAPGARWQAYGSGLTVSARCDEAGWFRLVRVPVGSIALRASSGWADASAQGEVTLEVMEGGVHTRELQLEFGRRISGSVVDPDGAPVQRAIVTAFSGSVRSRDTATGADGIFRISAIPESDDPFDEWELRVQAWSGVSVRTLAVRPRVRLDGEFIELVIEPLEEASGTITGRVRGSGLPLSSDIEASLMDQDGRGGSPLTLDPESGAFTKGPLSPGTYQIQLSRGGVPAGTYSGFRVRAGETIDAGTLRLDEGGTVELRPRDADEIEGPAMDALCASATAVLVGPGRRRTRLVWNDGAWAPRGLLEPGTWHLEVESQDVVVAAGPIEVESGQTTQQEFTAFPGRSLTLHVDLPPGPSWNELEVRLHGPSGGLLYRSGPVDRGSLRLPDRFSFHRAFPVGTTRVVVTTDTAVRADKTVLVPPSGEPVGELRVTAD